MVYSFFTGIFFLETAASDLCSVGKIHEIQAYLKDIEILVNNLKTELDLTRNLLYRTWLQHQNYCRIADSKKSIPVNFDFITKNSGSRKIVLEVQESEESNYESICNQLRELGFQPNQKQQVPGLQIKTSRVAYEYIAPIFKNLPYESFYIILLNTNNQLIKTVRISEGGISGTMVDLKRVFKTTLDNYATSTILAHNHPSGNLQPSISDEWLTKKIIEGGKLLDITIIDHLIIGNEGYFSFVDEGKMG